MNPNKIINPTTILLILCLIRTINSACHSFCSTCLLDNDNTQCTSCSLGYFEYGSTCSEVCPDGTYADESDPSFPICYDCNTNCALCAGPDIDECSQCTNDYYLDHD